LWAATISSRGFGFENEMFVPFHFERFHSGPSAVVPVRMAQLVLQGKSRASDVVKHDQFASVLRIGLASAEGTGRIQIGESALDRDPPLKERSSSAPAWLLMKVEP
jgi:hypothetical protein